MWLLFWIANIVDNIIWDPKSGIRAKIRVEAMAGEEGKASAIEKFDGIDFGYWRMQIEDYLYEKKLHQASFGDEIWNYEGWRLEPYW